MTAEAVLISLRHVWTALAPLNLPMALMGGLAMAAWRYARATRDVDVLIALGGTALDDVLRTLRQAGMRPRRSPPVTPLGPLDVLQLLYEPPDAFVDVQVDVLLARPGFAAESLARRVPVRLPGLDLELAVLSCEDLVLHKLQSGRIIDLADCAALLRANRGSLDEAYLSGTAERHGLSSDLARVRKEAMRGGQESPGASQ